MHTVELCLPQAHCKAIGLLSSTYRILTCDLQHTRRDNREGHCLCFLTHEWLSIHRGASFCRKLKKHWKQRIIRISRRGCCNSCVQISGRNSINWAKQPDSAVFTVSLLPQPVFGLHGRIGHKNNMGTLETGEKNEIKKGPRSGDRANQVRSSYSNFDDLILKSDVRNGANVNRIHV